MTLILKNKYTLQIDDFLFKCSIGKCGLTKRKVEGDKKLQEEFLVLGTYITEGTDLISQRHHLSAKKYPKTWAGVMTSNIPRNITD